MNIVYNSHLLSPLQLQQRPLDPPHPPRRALMTDDSFGLADDAGLTASLSYVSNTSLLPKQMGKLYEAVTRRHQTTSSSRSSRTPPLASTFHVSAVTQCHCLRADTTTPPPPHPTTSPRAQQHQDPSSSSSSGSWQHHHQQQQQQRTPPTDRPRPVGGVVPYDTAQRPGISGQSLLSIRTPVSSNHIRLTMDSFVTPCNCLFSTLGH